MYYMGVDVGSVSTDIVLLDEDLNLVESLYLRTKGKPINIIQEGFKTLKSRYKDDLILGVGVTGSGRNIASCLIGADVVKNEITAHAIAALYYNKDVKTIIEIGGQDSKIILIRDGVVVDFAMNTVCAAGTGSFLDRQAERLEIPIENFGDYALKSKTPIRIAGRCAVFAESDMIHKQQLGYKEEDIINGLCEALVRNYLNNVAKGKELKSPILFQGGVAANKGIKVAFEKTLGIDLFTPPNHKVMGAIGSAILSMECVKKEKRKSNFKGFNISNINFLSQSFECNDCPNRCEVVKIIGNDTIVGCFGDRCNKWNSSFYSN